MSSEAREYQKALTAASNAAESGDVLAFCKADALAVGAEEAFNAAGKRSHDYPAVQRAEARYHAVRTERDNRLHREIEQHPSI